MFYHPNVSENKRVSQIIRQPTEYALAKYVQPSVVLAKYCVGKMLFGKNVVLAKCCVGLVLC